MATNELGRRITRIVAPGSSRNAYPYTSHVIANVGTEDMLRNSPKLRAPEAAAYLGMSPSTLAKMRLRGDGPAYSKAGPRIVIYDKTDLDDWLAKSRRWSTSERIDAP